MNVTVSNRQRLHKVDTALLKAIARRALELTGTADSSLSIVLVDDNTIAALNQRYHHTEGPTDVLSFDYSSDRATSGEIIISVERAFSQAKQFKSTPSRELALYVVHGILHLHGHDDLTARKRTKMRAAERRIMASIESDLNLRGLVRRRVSATR